MTAISHTTATPHTTAETTYTVRRLTVPVPGVRFGHISLCVGYARR
jgi:hypothetical protein